MDLKGKECESEYWVTATEVQWSEFLDTDPEVPGSIPSAIRFSEKYCVWSGDHSALTEELLDR
jgi:hypothetical protein